MPETETPKGASSRLVTITLDFQGRRRPFTYPENLAGCVRGVFEGEYAYPKLPDERPVRTILDVGANVGAFSVWALQRWPNAVITAFEPNPKACELYVKNVPHVLVGIPQLAGRPEGFWHLLLQEAVADASNVKGMKPEKITKARLYLGRDWGYSSMDPTLNPHAEKEEECEVVLAHPSELPQADVVKLDAEGPEPFILEHYAWTDEIQVLMVEWHRPGDRERIEAVAKRADLRLFRSQQLTDALGLQVWARSKAVYSFKTGKYEMP